MGIPFPGAPFTPSQTQAPKATPAPEDQILGLLKDLPFQI